MKKILIFIIVILIVLLAFISFNSKRTEVPISQEVPKNENTESNLVSINDIPNGKFSVNTEKSSINWTGKKTIITDWVDTGTIDIQSGAVNISDSRINVEKLVIDMNSIKAETTGSGGGQDNLTNHLKSADFFDVENNPTSTFSPTNIMPAQEKGIYDVTGDLEIKGIENEIEFPVKLSEKNGEYIATGSVALDRTLWDIRFGSGKFFDNLGDNVIDDIINIDFKLIIERDEENTEE